ncbi:MAG TPA: hypothetical protein VNG53_02105, partial [Bacteroidia bacterium]|nr:hypothetical protein [Bacteroidia bacterium]
SVQLVLHQTLEKLKLIPMLENLELNKKRCWETFKIKSGKSVDYFTALAVELIIEYIDFMAQISKNKQAKINEVPTYSLRK